jgi:hypothetical protein
MPLQDHFHAPLALQRHWHSFHNSWATYIASALNAQLPSNFFAEAVHFGIEIDVATFEGNGGAGHGASWSPPAPTLTLPLIVATDIVEVRVFDRTADLGALFASAYRPVIRAEQTEVDIWHLAQRVGTPLPSLPLWIKGGPCLQVNLEAAYDRTCREQRIPGA